jgi:PKHD-type hydroxylase
MFNRYRTGETYGLHVDNAIRYAPGSPTPIRTDLSATLFLCSPQEYAGGELVIEDNFGSQRIKLEAGDLVLYPSTSLHTVTPVSSGARTCAVFWLQSMVRSNQQRETLFELDQSVQALTAELGPSHAEVVRLSGVYHNLIRQWADT